MTLPHLSKLQWAFIILAILVIVFLVIVGAIGGHASGGR